MNNKVNVIGAGLAGSEASLFLAKRGFDVDLYDMKPLIKSSAHKMNSFCELVCNNSFCSTQRKNPLNLLYKELKLLNSEVIKFIDNSRVDDDNCIAVDKRLLSETVTYAIKKNDNINVIKEQVTDIPVSRPTIVATGPLTSAPFLEKLKKRFKNMISITDANSIVLRMDSIDKSRITSVSNDTFEIHFNKKEYTDLENRLKVADTVIPHHDEDDFRLLQCLPVEVLATRSGKLAESKLKATTQSAFSTLVLRRDDRLSNSVVLSEFTTRMKFSEQERIIHSIRGLENAKFVRYGQLHYNTFIDAPNILNNHYEVNSDKGLYIIGQLSGIDGYLPAISSAIVAASSIIQKSKGLNPVEFPTNSIIGSLANYVSTQTSSEYRSMIPLFELLSNHTDNIEDIYKESLNKIEQCKV